MSDTGALRLFLAGLVADCPTREHAIVRIRGAQAGFFLHGLLLAVPPLGSRTIAENPTNVSLTCAYSGSRDG
ncbi:hypothetical protein ACTWPT_58320 [Nonomuraea sp. 3N208]|uniref:hypothetical protein n=1 Tax=Nonomuraea sp. 3N208 TaxID=3457421 RepID=UPI003FD1301C